MNIQSHWSYLRKKTVSPKEKPEPSLELETIVPEPEEVSLPEEDLALEIEEPVEKEKTLSDKEVNKKLEDFGEYDPKLDLSDYRMPGIDILVDHGDGQIKVDKEELEANKNRIVNTLEKLQY